MNGTRVKVLESLPVNTSQRTDKPAGTVISVGRNAILVACGTTENNDNTEKSSHNKGSATTLALTTLQLAGGKPMSAEQICHGNQLNDGDIFEIDLR